jgi:hypothetical protein
VVLEANRSCRLSQANSGALLFKRPISRLGTAKLSFAHPLSSRKRSR